MEYVGKAGNDGGSCFLCEAAEDGANPHVVERGDATLTVLNRFPYSSGHVLIAPRTHVPDLVSAPADVATAVIQAVRRAIRALDAALKPGGYNVGLNHGSVAGASVEHLHMHVVPRWGGDTNFMPVLGDVKVLPDHLLRTAEQLRTAFAALG
jgi:ATP adenylyltransferase